LVGAAYLGLSLLLGLVMVLVLATGMALWAPDLSALELDAEPIDPAAMVSLGPLALLPLIVGLLLGIPLMMAVLFAPALVALDSVPVGRALWLSLLGCWRNILPLGLFGLVALGLGIIGVFTFGLALLPAMPVLTLALYHAYRDIYRC
ncbi:MAG: BPSS1780 family membrane protein, partial [Bdellovibrio bacteriovorus]